MNNEIGLREYFAAHAPDVPEWFRHPDVVETLPPKDVGEFAREHDAYTRLKYDDSRKLMQYLRGSSIAATPEGALKSIADEILQRYTEYSAKRSDQLGTNEAARFFAWRMHYAGNMVALRVKDERLLSGPGTTPPPAGIITAQSERAPYSRVESVDVQADGLSFPGGWFDCIALKPKNLQRILVCARDCAGQTVRESVYDVTRGRTIAVCYGLPGFEPLCWTPNPFGECV